MRIQPHLPVLLNQTISNVMTSPDGIYLDGTVGFGGHAKNLIKKLSPKGKLIGIDLDPYALDYTKKNLSKFQKSYSLHNNNYREYPFLLQSLGIKKLTGMIFDLGSSSSQLNTGHRGFSFQSDAPLDMRFNPNSKLTASYFLNNSKQEEISNIIKLYGEEKHYRNIARNIAKLSKAGKMNTTFDLKNAVSKCVHPRYLNKSLARVFQSIRIRVNDELESLKKALQNSISFLEIGGRIAIISFHSIEDKIVKSFYKKHSLKCLCPPEFPICKCNTMPSLRVLTNKAIIPDKIEIESNPRSRSAKLRIAERV